MKKFNIERYVTQRVKEVNPIRISNNRKPQYNGPKIESHNVLVSDYKFN